MALDFLAHVRAESSRFGEVLRDADPAAAVPTCPDWTADDLLYHLAEVFDSWTRVVRDGANGEEIAPPERPADRPALVALYDRATADLLDTLASTPGDRPIWSWVSEDVTASWVHRRMAHEALIHRIDAELTTGTLSDVDAQLAADGVAEVVRYFFGWRAPWSEVFDGPLARLAATDTGDEWLVQVGTWSGTSPVSGNTYEGEPCLSLVADGVPAFSITSTARDLDAWLWNRPTISPPVIDGDASTLQAMIAKGLQ